jgi:histidinol-phosphate aminotransferase
MNTQSSPTLTAYAPPLSRYAVDLKLDANEGRPPPAALLAPAAAAALAGVHRYPNALPLEARLARSLALDPACVLVTAGGDDALDRVCRAFLTTGRGAVMTTPTFEMIPRAVRAIGADLIELPWWDGPFPTRDVIARIDNRTGIVFVVSPNNPTGNIASADDLRTISAAAPEALLCVDLAYTEYADADLTRIALSLPNAVIVRTLSKAWGLAGLRVGYAAGPRPLIDRLRMAGGPFPTSTISLALADAWLDAGTDFMADTVRATRVERDALARLLRSLGVNVINSHANFVLAGFASPDAASTLADTLARDHRIGVRRYPPTSPLSCHLRITCPCDAASFNRLTAALRDALVPNGAPA